MNIQLLYILGSTQYRRFSMFCSDVKREATKYKVEPKELVHAMVLTDCMKDLWRWVDWREFAELIEREGLVEEGE